MIVILVISTYKLPWWDSSLASIGGTAERKLHQLTYIRTSAYVLQGLKFVYGASNYINWRLRTSLNHKSLWTDEWVKSSIHKLHKMLAPNWFLYLKVPQLKSKFAPSRKLHPQSDHIINIHTKQVKSLCMDLSWIPRKFWHPPLKPTWNWAQFQKAQLASYKTSYAFSAHLQARELLTSTNLHLSLPLEWSQVTHIPTSIKMGGA